MRPTDKAKELVDKFIKQYPINYDKNGNSFFIKEAKQCALICVDEILTNTGCGDCRDIDSHYWQQVKTSIQNL